MKATRIPRSLIGLFVAAAATAAVSACDKTTGGNLISLPFLLGGVERDGGGPMYFTNQLGWQVELDQALVAVGPFYFNAQPPQTNTLRSGVVIMENVQQSVVNVLDPTLYAADGGVSGETGHAVSVEIDLVPPDSTQSPQNQQLLNYEATAYITGVATQQSTAADGGLVIPFAGYVAIVSGMATPADPLDALQRVGGAGCDLEFTDQPAALQLRIDPTHWFDGIEFNWLVDPFQRCEDPGPIQAWTPDQGPATWCVVGPPSEPTSSFNGQMVTGIQAQSGVYLFNLVSLADGGS
jgi:hypothetical protein